MSEANRTAVRFAKETSFRTAPASPVFQELRFNSESVSYTPTTEVSSEIDSTRQVRDLILTGYEAGGDLNCEYSITNGDVLMEGAMCRAWTRTPEVRNGAHWAYGASATRISSVTATELTTAATSWMSGSVTNSPATVVAPQMLLRFSGFGDANDNQLYVATASTATTVTIAGATANAAPPATARVKVVGVQGASGDITAVTAGGNGLVTTTLNWTTMGLVVGQWVKISAEGGNFSFTTTANLGYCRISAISATKLSFDIVPVGWTADTGTGKTIRVFFGDTIRNGITEFSYRMEKEYGLEVGTRYAYFRGMEVGTMSVSADTRAIVTQTFSFTGSEGTIPSATRDVGAVTQASNSNSVLDSSNSVPMILEAGGPVGTPNYVSSFSFQIENNLRAQAAVGSAGAIGVGLGRSDITGTLATYFGDETYLTKLINNTSSSVTVTFRDAAMLVGEIWDIPRLKYSAGVPEVTGIDTDIFATLNFQAIRDTANNRDYTIMLSRFGYLA